jgi:hypothetical protein
MIMRGHTRFERAIAILIGILIAVSGRATGADCDGNGLYDADEIAAVPSLDCNENGILDSCDLEVADQFSFETRVGHRVQRGASSVVIADVNGDGELDFAVANELDNSVSLFGWRGVREYDLDRHYPTGETPRAITSGDFNGDGHIDLATCDWRDGAVSILYNLGPGLFAPPFAIGIGGASRPIDLASGDINRDGAIDLVTLNEGQDDLTILLNADHAGFGVPRRQEAGRDLQAFELVDVNDDEILDLVVISHGSTSPVRTGAITVLLGDGDGAFESAGAPILDVEDPQDLTLVDLDGDDTLDLLLAQNPTAVDGQPRLLALRGDGEGGFERMGAYLPATDSNFSFGTHAVGAGDVDGDGDHDVVFATASRRVILLRNDGAGSLTGPREFYTGLAAWAVAIEDLDGDGLADALCPTSGGNFDGAANVYYSRWSSVSADCNANGAPDECDVRDGTSADGNRNLVPDECEPDCNDNGRLDDLDIERGDESDCDQDSVPDSCQIAAASSLDCDDDGILDSCQNDCNRNGVPDPCEIASGSVEDANGNGVPDSCENEPTFFIEFAKLGEAGLDRGGRITQDVGVLLHTTGIEDGEPGAQGWSLSIGLGDGCPVFDIHVRGTVAADVQDDPPGLRNTGFQARGRWHGGRGVALATILSFTMPITLAPEDSPHLIARLVVGADPMETGGCFECQVRLEESDLSYPTRISNVVTLNGNTHEILSEPFVVEACVQLFHRGDATADGRLDISDGVGIVSHLFLGSPQPSCLEAADTNDDGLVDITDAVYVLGFLFTGGPAPPHPGPPGQPCGVDPADSPARFSCEAYPPCSS